MAVFLVISEFERPELRPAIERAFPDKHFHWTPTVSFVRTGGPAQSVAAAVGIQMRSSDGTITPGFDRTVVVQASPSYWGWANSALWPWLKAAFEAVD